ncbi:MAG: acetyltransferase [Aeromicrobium sp.]|nr:acetyltransferase [Aeromicrobium sp.]
MLLQTIVADVRSNVDHTRRAGLGYWARVLGKLAFAPAVQVVVIFRLSSALYQYRITRPLAYMLRGFTIVWGGTEIHPSASIGPGFCLVHSQKILIGADVRIGSNARISHGVSIGGDTGRGTGAVPVGSPILGDDVTMSLDSIILGSVTVGDGAVVGAQALVVRDVPAHAIVVGSPARVVRIIETDGDDTITSSDRK